MKFIFKIFFLYLIFVYCKIFTQDFNKIWYDTQQIYLKLINSLDNKKNNLYISATWLNVCQEVAKLLLDKPNNNFLQENKVRWALIRGGYSVFQKFEEVYLEHCISNKTKSLIFKFKDNDNNLLPKESTLFNCSTHTLGQLYYFARILENLDFEPKIFVEFGAGYGNLIRIIKSIFPNSTIVIIDIPEIIALQNLFLTYTSSHLELEVHNNLNKQITTDKKIHLIPINLLEDLNIEADIFISTFALSESNKIVQNIVINKQFFNAKLCYLAGQINKKSEINTWISDIDHENILSSLRIFYKDINCIPFHIFFEIQASYEVIAKNKGI